MTMYKAKIYQFNYRRFTQFCATKNRNLVDIAVGNCLSSTNLLSLGHGLL